MHTMTQNPTSTSAAIEIDLRPSPEDWSHALASHTPNPARTELGLPNDQPIVFSGHQPIVFHNGILAKLIAQHVIATKCNAHPVWIVADQDEAALESVRVPTGSNETLRASLIQILPPGSIPPGVPPASLPAMDPLETDDERLNELAEYLRGYAYESTLARQFASATIQLACDRLSIPSPTIIYTSELNRSATITNLIQETITDARSCVGSYNNAVAQHPGAGVRPLRIDDDEIELPLWGMRQSAPRIPITTKNAARFTQQELVPRGLFMSAIARTRLGELFIHGTGGWAYDLITQDWMSSWENRHTNPMALATATLRLPLGIDNHNATNLKDAHWRFHHARHHPAFVGDTDTQRTRDELVSQINTAQAANENPDPIYQQLVRVLEDHRVRNADALNALESQIEHARTHEKQIALANDRTWAFPLFHDDALHALKDRIHDALR